MTIIFFWFFLTLSITCILISELIQGIRQKKYILLLAHSTGIAQDVSKLKYEEKVLKSGIIALQKEIEGFKITDSITINNLLSDLSDLLEEHSESEILKQLRIDIKKKINSGTATESLLTNKTEIKRASSLILSAFNCKVDTSLNKLKSTNVGHIIEEIKNSFDIINMNAIGLKTNITRSYLEMRINEAKLGSILHHHREIQKEEQIALREEMREENRVNREQERLQKEAEREEKIKEELLKVAQEAASNASEAERAIYEERVRQLEEEVYLAKEKAKKVSMAQMTKIGTVYIISNIGSFGEGVVKIGMTRRLEPTDRINELSSASVPFEFDIHALIPTRDAPKLESDLHSYFNEKRLNKVNMKKEFFEVPITEIKKYLEDNNISANFSLIAKASQFRESQAISTLKVSNIN